jgi:predicted DNA-binding transcriptional regulator AlpA
MTQRLITCKEVTYLTGLPRASVYAEMKRGFPLPVPRGGSRAVAWVETEVQKLPSVTSTPLRSTAPTESRLRLQ